MLEVTGLAASPPMWHLKKGAVPAEMAALAEAAMVANAAGPLLVGALPLAKLLKEGQRAQGTGHFGCSRAVPRADP